MKNERIKIDFNLTKQIKKNIKLLIFHFIINQSNNLRYRNKNEPLDFNF